MDGISICLTAWNTQDYIEECLDSVANQTWFKKHDNWEILLGIDACEKTLEKVKQIQHKYQHLTVYKMTENVGTYVTSNTIMSLAKYDWIQRFDTDDIMYPKMIETIFAKKGDAELVIPYDHPFPNNRTRLDRGEGQLFFSKRVFDKYGGFMAWKCGADTEFIKRTSGHIKQYALREALFDRRIHKTSLTQEKSTGYNSTYRRQNAHYIDTKSKSTPVITLKIAPCKKLNFVPRQLILSFTTWKKRHEAAAKMLENLKKQTTKPDKIYCWLSSDEYGGENIPKCLQKFVDEKFIEVKWVKKNTYCHKRYEVFREHYNDYVFLVDDDIYYKPNYIKELYYIARKHPKAVIVSCSRVVDFVNNQRIVHACPCDTEAKNIQLLSGLCCYPPNTFPLEYFEHVDKRDEVCPKCDDSWVRAWLLKKGTNIVACHSDENLSSFTLINGTKENSIWYTNNSKNVGGVQQVVLNIGNAIKAIGVVDEAKKVWPKFNLI